MTILAESQYVCCRLCCVCKTPRASHSRERASAEKPQAGVTHWHYLQQWVLPC